MTHATPSHSEFQPFHINAGTNRQSAVIFLRRNIVVFPNRHVIRLDDKYVRGQLLQYLEICRRVASFQPASGNPNCL